MNSNRTRKLLIIFISVLMGSSALDAKEQLNVVRGRGNYPPNEMVVDGKLIGVHIDLVYAIANRLDWEVQLQSLPWKRGLNMFRVGKVDAITSLGKRPEREAFTYYLEENILSYAEMAFFTAKGQEGKFGYTGDMKQLQSYSIVMLRGYSYGKQFDEAKELTKYPVDRMAQQIRLVIQQRFPIGIAKVADLKYAAKGLGLPGKIVFLEPYVSKHPLYIGFSKVRKNKAMAKQFAQEFTVFKKTVAYQEILSKYGVK